MTDIDKLFNILLSDIMVTKVFTVDIEDSFSRVEEVLRLRG